jgi:hypothetical protein
MDIINLDLILFILFILFGFISLKKFRAFKLPVPIILFVLGIILRFFVTNLIIEPFLIFCMVVLIFDAGAHFIPRKFDKNSFFMFDFIIVSIILNSVIVGSLLYFFVFSRITSLMVLYSFLLGSMITACSQFEILKSFKIKKNNLYDLTILEDHLSNPIILFLSIFLINYIFLVPRTTMLFELNRVLSSLLIDVGIGVFLGLIMLFVIVRLFKRKKIHTTTFLFAFFTFFISIQFGGTGFIAVIILSLFFHNVSTHVSDLGEFTPFVRNLVYVIIFILMGYMVSFNFYLFLLTILLFIFYLLIRYILFFFLFKKVCLFMAFDCPKGLSIGSITLFAMILLENISFNSILILELFSILIVFYIMCIILSYMLNLIKKDITC